MTWNPMHIRRGFSILHEKVWLLEILGAWSETTEIVPAREACIYQTAELKGSKRFRFYATISDT